MTEKKTIKNFLSEIKNPCQQNALMQIIYALYFESKFSLTDDEINEYNIRTACNVRANPDISYSQMLETGRKLLIEYLRK